VVWRKFNLCKILKYVIEYDTMTGKQGDCLPELIFCSIGISMAYNFLLLTQLLLLKVKSRDRPRWPKAFRVV